MRVRNVTRRGTQILISASRLKYRESSSVRREHLKGRRTTSIRRGALEVQQRYVNSTEKRSVH
jgi:hypothetical protein